MTIQQISPFYQQLIEEVPLTPIVSISHSNKWCMVQTKNHAGFAMMCPSHKSIDLNFLNTISNLQDLASEISSFHLSHASFAMAAINCHFNNKETLTNSFPQINIPSTIDLVEYLSTNYQNKKVVSIGAFAFLKNCNLNHLQIIEKQPKNDEFPDTASEYLIENADLILMTGATIINKSFERLTSLAKTKEVFLIGPSVPYHPQLFSSNIKLFGYTIVEPLKCCKLIKKNLGKKLLSSESVKRLDNL